MTYTGTKKLKYQKKYNQSLFLEYIQDDWNAIKDKNAVYKKAKHDLNVNKNTKRADLPNKYIVSSSYLNKLEQIYQGKINEEFTKYQNHAILINEVVEALNQDISELDKQIADNETSRAEIIKKINQRTVENMELQGLRYERDLLTVKINNLNEERGVYIGKKQAIIEEVNNNNTIFHQNEDSLELKCRKRFRHYAVRVCKKIKNKLSITDNQARVVNLEKHNEENMEVE